MQLNELIKSLNEVAGGEFTVENDTCTIGIDDMVVTIQEIAEEGIITTYAEIGEPPPQGLEQLLDSMLQANYLFQGTGGATISRDPESGKFFLCRCDASDTLDGEKFLKMVEKFVNVLETWVKLLANYRPAEESQSADMAGQTAESDYSSRFDTFMHV